MKPVIGITMMCEPDPVNSRSGGKMWLNWNYPEVVAEYGGLPILIPPHAALDELAPLLDGLLIPGGGDFDARLYGEENHPKADGLSPERFYYERELYDRLEQQVPVLGICYGCQFINVVRGGSLIQHVPEVVGHDVDTLGAVQEYQLVEGTKLHSLLSAPDARGESWHHQAVKQVGHNLRVSAWNSDGIVEAVEAVDRPWMIGVQWHPERTRDNESSAPLFRSFIAAATEYRARRFGG